MTRTRGFTLSAIVAVSFLVVPAASLWAQANAPQNEQEHQSHQPAAGPSSDVKQDAHEHPAEGPRGMMADRAAADARLDALVAKMNASKGDRMMANPEMKKRMEEMMDKKGAGR